MNDTLTCPRCSVAETELLTRSPVPDVWTVHRCPRCGFVWRSTEPETITDPQRYPAQFRVTEDDLTGATDVPQIPERRA